MPITINGSGSITGISAGGLPDDCITTADIAANAVTYAKLGTTEQGQLCKAWVNFNGTGVVAIRASYNVSSITDNGVGNYNVNFTSALTDANYVPVVTAWSANSSMYMTGSQTNNFAPTSSAYRIRLNNGGAFNIDTTAGDVDLPYIFTSVFR